VAQCNGGRSLVLLCHGSRRKEGQHLQHLGITSYFPFLFFALSFFHPSFLRRKEGQHLQHLGITSYFPFLFFALSFFHPSFLFCPDTGKDVRREQQMGHEDIGVRNGDRQL
jgi:hypothetical protein